jgi:hypothetical protein
VLLIEEGGQIDAATFVHDHLRESRRQEGQDSHP